MDIACVNILNQLKLSFFFFLISGDQCYTMNTSCLHGSFSPPDSNSQGVDVGVKNI